MLLLGPQKMCTASWLASSSSCRFCSTLCRLEWAMTRRLVRRPTSLWWPMVGASFMRITQSDRSISPPLWLPVSQPELETREQLLQCIFRGCHDRVKVKGDCRDPYLIVMCFLFFFLQTPLGGCFRRWRAVRSSAICDEIKGTNRWCVH